MHIQWACMGLVDVCVGIQRARTWAGVGIWWAWACGDPAGTDGRAWGSSRHGHVGIQQAWTCVRGDPLGTGVQQEWACDDPAGMDMGVRGSGKHE